MSVVALIDQRINAAACNGKTEVLASLVELKAAMGNQEHNGNRAWKRSFDLNVSLTTACESLRSQLTQEEGFSRYQIERRAEAEDYADKLLLSGAHLEKLLSAVPKCECKMSTRFCRSCLADAEREAAIVNWKGVAK